MSEQQVELERWQTRVVAVTFEAPARVAQVSMSAQFPYKVLSDPERRAYATFGLERGRPAQLWNWDSLMAYLRGLRQGRLPTVRRADITQLGGDVVLAPDGRLVYLHRSTGVADRPPVAEIVAAVRRAVMAERAGAREDA